ncbi:helix-turn-helix domain-containing protein [Neokomagataea thailandica]|uniref:Transcriptional regulator n=1 Tax=Neokomagataea tanensis NBRC 106556 TaxID=1223519 RepID=A0ABQ0QGV2_9PROT|nr:MULTISPECIES: helix-turn-helix transcriptional regulator [Neokomagataea]GBR44307.1 transcriptional regulator [Neokomagataea tanensis NBRC 106556]
MSKPQGKTESKNVAGSTDVHIGHRIRLRRTLMGLSQESLGEALGVTFQQVQKYERGANRVSASRLFELAQALDVPVGFFYDGQLQGTDAKPALNEQERPFIPSATPSFGFAETQAGFGGPPPSVPKPAQATRLFDASEDEAALFSKRETVDLVRAYYRISDPGVRKHMLDLVRSIASTAEA